MWLPTFFFLIFVWNVTSYKILGLFPTPSKSHSLLFLPLMKGLARKGHQVTVLSHFPLSEPLENYTDMPLDSSKIVFQKNFISGNVQDFGKGTLLERWAMLTNLRSFAQATSPTITSSSVQTLLRSNQSFDLIIAYFFVDASFLSLVEKFQAPVVGFGICVSLPWINRVFGTPVNPAYMPHPNQPLSDKMSFMQRVENFLMIVVYDLHFLFVSVSDNSENVRQVFGRDVDYWEIAKNSSLLLLPLHFSFNLPRPLTPTIIEIGGIHLQEVETLPKNLEKWINESTHGVIYFSLGSMIKGHTFPEEKRQEFLRAFGRLPQRVLWKYENETMPGKPDNVMIQKWMPQLDILCHPNVKAFISHGGLLGTTEAVHCGVPVMVMPQYGDQFTNAKALEANGGGVILHLYEATEEKVYEALKTILDPKFKKQAEDLSARFRDRPLPPLETAIYWVEYVARHRGAPHMRTAAVGMPLYKYLLLDVIAFLLLVFTLISALFFYVTRAVFRKLFSKKNKQKTN